MRYADNRFYLRWKEHSAAMRARHGMRPTWMPWTMDNDLKGIRKNNRVVEAINIAWGVTLKKRGLKGAEAMKSNLLIDLSQNIHKLPFMVAESNKALNTSTTLFFYGRSGAVLPKEHLMLQGWPQSVKTDGLRVSDILELSGEGWFIPSAQAVFSAIIHATKMGTAEYGDSNEAADDLPRQLPVEDSDSDEEHFIGKKIPMDMLV